MKNALLHYIDSKTQSLSSEKRRSQGGGAAAAAKTMQAAVKEKTTTVRRAAGKVIGWQGSVILGSELGNACSWSAMRAVQISVC